MFNNDFIKGYISALENIKSTINVYKIDAVNNDAKEAFNDVSKFIDQVKENYKLLVKDLNDRN